LWPYNSVPEGVEQDHLSSYNTTKDFIDALRALSVPGPLDLTDHLTTRSFIAEGASFSVYENFISGWDSNTPWNIHRVVVKKCHFKTQPDQRLDLSSETCRRQVHDMYLEVLALRHPVIKDHRNIVKLLGWTLDSGLSSLPLLVLEIAVADLGSFLVDNADLSDQWRVRHQICLDMAAGLDVLHENGIVHADFKPSNVLIFSNTSTEVPYVAKLADFGFAAIEEKSLGGDMISVNGWSDGWQAPEIDYHIRQRTPISCESYCRADRYSLGLVVWSTFCWKGAIPPDGSNPDCVKRAIGEVQKANNLPLSLKETICSSLERILAYEPSERPSSVTYLFRDGSDTFLSW
jgi:serine/threonine protein kinase